MEIFNKQILNMSKYKQRLQLMYKDPLPIDVVFDQAIHTTIIPYNFVSWVQLVMEYLYKSVSMNKRAVTKLFQKEAPKIVVQYESGVYKVEIDGKNDDALQLWRRGFFGKGILSRSEPTWYGRTQRRLKLVSSYGMQDLSSEEVTQLRRQERRQFKELRQTYEAKQLALEKRISEAVQKHTSESVLGLVEELEQLKAVKLKNENLNSFRKSHTVDIYEGVAVRDEDRQIIKNGVLDRLEYLQLMPEEVMFLQFAVGAIDVGTSSAALYSRLAEHGLFRRNYAVYHYYRSRGWCVRSGIKFGVDYLLYDKGPPLSHAEYCLHIVDENCQLNYIEFSSLHRVIGGVRKTLVLVYVKSPSSQELELLKGFSGDKYLRQLLKLYQITEVVYRRWLPSRNRD